MSAARRQCAPLAAALLLLLLLAAGCALASASRTDDGVSGGSSTKKGGKNPSSRRASPPPARRRYPPPAGSAGGLTSRPPPAASGGDTRERIDLVVFGDSLSDTGNTFRAAGVPQADLYYKGRYSNGPVWIDYLAAEVANNNSATTVLNVINLAYGGATACPAYSVAAQYPFVLDLPQQTAAFLSQPPAASTAAAALRHAQGQGQAQAQAAAQAAALALAALEAVVQAALGVGSGAGGGSSRPNGGGGGRRLLPINFIGTNDVRFIANEAIRTGVFPNASVIAAAVASITSCRLTWAQQLLAAGEAVWGQQRGPERVLVLLPVARLDLSPSVPEPFKPAVAAFTVALNSALTLAAAALEVQLQQPAAATGGADSAGARLLVLPDASEELLASVNPPFTNTSPCFIQPKVALEVVPGIVPCPDPNTRAFYDQLHPSTRFHAAIGLTGVLPSLRLAGLLPA